MSTICFATMCKNERHVITRTLEAVLPFVDAILVYDTGSTDGTLEAVADFFDKHRDIAGSHPIVGRIVRAPWEGFAISKTKMMAQAREMGCGYILHLDADDIVQMFDPAEISSTDGKDCYFATLTRGTASWQATILYDARLTWRFCGVAHTVIRCAEKPRYETGALTRCRVSAEALGSRIFDPDKYVKDAMLLVAQFHETAKHDPDGLHARSAFYAAQSYFDAGRFAQAFGWYGVFLSQGTWSEEIFEAHIRTARCCMAPGVNLGLGLDTEALLDLARNHLALAIATLPDRAEPHALWGIWCNRAKLHDEAYEHLELASALSLDTALAKYLLFVDRHAYGKFLADERSVACYWTKRYAKGIELARSIVDDPDFAGIHENILYNLGCLERELARESPAPAPSLPEPAPAPVPATANTARLVVERVTRAPARIVIADDFYAVPEAVRAFALEETFVASPQYHRGRRTLQGYRSGDVRVDLERLLGRKITKWNYEASGVFQICTATDPIVYHTDDQQYAAIVFLTPDAPLGAGLSLYRERITGARDASGKHAPVPRYDRGHYDSSQFDLVDKIGNVWNRCVIWDAHMIHAASSYFGDTDVNARLFQIFFFDAE